MAPDLRPYAVQLSGNPDVPGLAYLTLGGSHSYGTNIESSDVDVRGFFMGYPSELLRMYDREHYTDQENDIKLYSLHYYIKLLKSCNPMVIENLFTKPEHQLHVSKFAKMLLDNRTIFLSQRAINSFNGYADQQLARLENALARDRLPQSKKEQHILQSIKRSMDAMSDRYVPLDDNFRLYAGESQKSTMDSEIFIDLHLEHYPLRDFRSCMNDMLSIVRNYEKANINHRNHKKDDIHLSKHAMHLLRQLITGTELLSTGTFETYRAKEHDLLMEVRNGKFLNPDGSWDMDGFHDVMDPLREKMNYAIKHTVLPEEPDEKAIWELEGIMISDYLKTMA